MSRRCSFCGNLVGEKKIVKHMLSVDESVRFNEECYPEKPIMFELAGSGTVHLGIEEAYRLGWNLIRATINSRLTLKEQLACCRQQLTNPEGNPCLTVPAGEE